MSGVRQGASLRGKAFRNAFHVVSVPRGRVWQVVNALRGDPRVRFPHPDWIAHALDIPPNDPFHPKQWNLQSPDASAGSTRIEGAWAVNAGGDAHPTDDESHGTHVAGTVAQATNNAVGVAGIAYNVSLMPVKVLGANGSGSISAIADGIRWAADHGAQVINMSFGIAARSARCSATWRLPA